MKTSSILKVSALAAVGLVAGCYTTPMPLDVAQPLDVPVGGPQRRGYMSPNEDVYGSSSKLEATQKRLSVVQALEQMFTDPMFTEKYNEALTRARAAGHLRPSLTVRPIEDNTGPGSDRNSTAQMHRELVTALRKSGKFEMIDRAARSIMSKEAVNAVDEGESPEAIAGIGSFRSADFTMMGEIAKEETKDRGRTVYHHNVNLQMIDTRTGSVFWSDTVTFVKAGGTWL